MLIILLAKCGTSLVIILEATGKFLDEKSSVMMEIKFSPVYIIVHPFESLIECRSAS